MIIKQLSLNLKQKHFEIRRTTIQMVQGVEGGGVSQFFLCYDHRSSCCWDWWENLYRKKSTSKKSKFYILGLKFYPILGSPTTKIHSISVSPTTRLHSVLRSPTTKLHSIWVSPTSALAQPSLGVIGNIGISSSRTKKSL